MPNDFVYLQLFNFKKKKYIYRQYLINFFFIKKPKTIKFSSLLSFLIKKKNTFFYNNIDFFFYNNIYLIFLKKTIELLYIFKKDIIFFTDFYSEKIANINVLNFYLNKKNYIFFKLKKYNELPQNLNILKNNFCFFFTKQLNIKFTELNNYINICPLVNYSITPIVFNFFLPVIIDFNFSIFFYRFFFFNFFSKTI